MNKVPNKPTRGPSAANKRAEAYFKRHPNTSRRELAQRFEIHPTTISRALWWKARNNFNNNQKGE